MISIPGSEQAAGRELHPVGGKGRDRHKEEAHVAQRHLRVEVAGDQAQGLVLRMARQARDPERDLEWRPHRNGIRPSALILDKAGKLPAARRRDLVDPGDSTLPPASMNFLAGK